MQAQNSSSHSWKENKKTWGAFLFFFKTALLKFNLYIHKIYPFQVYDSVIYIKFIEFCEHCHNPILGHFLRSFEKILMLRPHVDQFSQTFWGDLGSFPSSCEMQHIEKDYCGGYEHRRYTSGYSQGTYSLILGTVDILSWIILLREGLAVLYIVCCLATSLAFTHQMLVLLRPYH